MAPLDLPPPPLPSPGGLVFSWRVAARISRAILDAFDRHFALMREVGRRGQTLFEAQDFAGIQRTVAMRIDFYTARVEECVAQLTQDFSGVDLQSQNWERVKLEYISLLIHHSQPELAETFFNTVSCRVLNRSYFNNQFIFVRPSISTEYLDLEQASYRCYYPKQNGLRTTFERIVLDFGLKVPFSHLTADVAKVIRALRRSMPRPVEAEHNNQLQILQSLFFRGNAAYIVGRAVNGASVVPFVVSILHDDRGGLVLDALLVDAGVLNGLFSSTRAYFLVDVDVPSTYVSFLHRMLPHTPPWELYAMLGLAKMSKSLFYRDYLHHLRHSSDAFTLAPGTRGLVMLVFTLPSFPYVFKLIKDKPDPPKDTDRTQVKAQYQLVKRTDRVGRMADTLEYSDVGFPLARFSKPLLDELWRVAPSLLQLQGDTLFVKHLYIERRLKPLDLYLAASDDAQAEAALKDFGACLKELAAANVFAGDLLFKNFGVTRGGRVVFYDYDEIDLVTNCRFRMLPQAQHDEDDTRSEPWFSVSPGDVFPEEWPRFLFSEARFEAALNKHHADLFEASWWQRTRERLASGQLIHVLPYPEEVRFGAGGRS